MMIKFFTNSFKRRRQLNQDGAAAMLTVIFISIILLVITISYIRLSVIESRQTSDADLSSRAFYGTESGLEEAKRAIREVQRGAMTIDQLNKDTCKMPQGFDPVLSSNDRYDIEITCMIIDVKPDAYIFNLNEANKTVKVPLDAVNSLDASVGINEVKIEWHVNGTSSVGGDGELDRPIRLRSRLDESLLNVPTWVENRNYPAMLDISLYARPRLSNFDSSDLESYKLYANPARGFGGIQYRAFGANVEANGEIAPARCDPDTPIGDYVCELNLRQLGGQSRYKYLQISNLYQPTQVRVTPFDNNDNNKNFNGGQAQIDITARSGDVYRRIKATMELAPPSLIPDASITTSGSICKNFAITDQSSDFLGLPGSSCTR